MQNQKKWSFKKHILFSIICAFFIDIIISFLVPNKINKISTIFIGQSGDGPTSLFVTSNFYLVLIGAFLVTMVVMLSFYNLIKLVFNKHFLK